MSLRIKSILFEGLSRLFAPRRAAETVQNGEKEVIEGSAGNVIIVKSPNTEYFKEAIFILCDDPLARRGMDKQRFLQEARRAAHSYTAARVPPRDLTALWHLFYYLLGAASALIALILIRLL